jgi:alkyl hydroperoxide reductase subunit AhpC
MSDSKSQTPTTVLRIGDTAPDFTSKSQLGDFNLYKYIDNKWAILFSHPADFTPVCTTELGRVAQLKSEFAKRNVAVAALSVDSVEHHQQWIKDINEINNCDVDFPIIADTDRKIAVLYNMLNQEHLDQQTGLPLTVRAVYFIGPDKKIKAIIIYPAPLGRNFDEILRVIDALQLAVTHKVAAPADWQKGKDMVVLPTVPTEEAQKLFPKGVNVVRPWLRTTPDPTTV